MRLGARLTGAELALLARLGAAGWTTNRQRFPLRDLHAPIMQLCLATRCSLLTSALGHAGKELLLVLFVL
jgi:hypothetical protein